MHRYSQRLSIAKARRIEGISVRLATYHQSGLGGRLTLTLSDAGGRVLATATRAARDVVDNVMYAFRFDKSVTLKPGAYVFALSFDPRGETRPLTAWSMPNPSRDNVLRVDGRAVDARMDYQLDEPVANAPTHAAPRIPTWIKAWMLWVAGGLLLVCAYVAWRSRHRLQASVPPVSGREGQQAGVTVQSQRATGALWFRRWYRWVFFAGLYVCYLVILFTVCTLGDVDHVGRDLVRLVAPLLELGLLALLCASCARMARRYALTAWLIAGVCIAGVACLVYLAQIYSLWLSNNFISVLALQNTDSVSFIDSSALAVGALVGIAWLAVFCLGAWRSAYPRPARRTTLLERCSSRTFLTLLVVLVLGNAWLFTLQSKNAGLEPGFRQTPLNNLLANLYKTKVDGSLVEPKAAAAGGDAACFTYATQQYNQQFPFQKSRAYRDALPFPAIQRDVVHPNVIVIFTEGTSTRLIGAYGGKYPDLTPNIDRLAARSMQTDNYFNHTAATYRGLIGQLSSGYSFAGGSGKTGWETGANKTTLRKIRRQTLPTILNGRGYQSYFFSPHKTDTPFTLMLRSLGFDRVYTYESIGKQLLDGHFIARPRIGALSDRSLFDGLVAFLKQRAAADRNKPFFIGTYNIGTHAFIGMGDHGVGYRDGASPVLNKLHNYDHALGRFLDYFYRSGFARNTIVVFTSDHATYPETAYRKAAGKGLKPYFVDRIPLLVLDPTHRLPKAFDADGRDSLDLAPTVLQLLGIRRVQNSFLGHSLFEPRNFPQGLAALGPQFFLTMRDGVFSAGKIPSGLHDVFACERNVVRRYYQAERSNHLFR